LVRITSWEGRKEFIFSPLCNGEHNTRTRTSAMNGIQGRFHSCSSNSRYFGMRPAVRAALVRNNDFAPLPPAVEGLGREGGRWLGSAGNMLGINLSYRNPPDWCRQSMAYWPPCRSNSSCVPSSTMHPSFSTSNRSRQAIVDSRCAIAITVLPSISPINWS
jgi:hypothetical protein